MMRAPIRGPGAPALDRVHVAFDPKVAGAAHSAFGPGSPQTTPTHDPVVAFDPARFPMQTGAFGFSVSKRQGPKELPSTLYTTVINASAYPISVGAVCGRPNPKERPPPG